MSSWKSIKDVRYANKPLTDLMGNPGSWYLCGYVFFDHKTLK